MRRVGIFHWLARICSAPCLAAALWAAPATASGLLAPADPGALAVDERRIVQSALAIEGLYAGLADGAWGPGADAAMARYAARRFGAAPINAHIAALTLDFAKARARDGWRMIWRPRERASFAAPMAILTATDRNGTRIWESAAGDLMILLGQGGGKAARATHDAFARKAAGPAHLFRLNEDGALLTSAQNGAGRGYFVRSARMDGVWTTLAIIADPARKDAMNGIAASLSFGAPVEWRLPEGGALSAMLAETVAAWEGARIPGAGAGGAGFYVSARGAALTHAHAVTGCATMASGGRRFRVAALDAGRDLALLRPETPFAPPGVAAFAAGAGKGAADADPAGGPVLDAHGLVAGVAMGPLDAMKTGAGAIPARAARHFLSAEGVDFRVGIPGAPLDAEALAARAASFTIPLTCN